MFQNVAEYVFLYLSLIFHSFDHHNYWGHSDILTKIETSSERNIVLAVISQGKVGTH